MKTSQIARFLLVATLPLVLAACGTSGHKGLFATSPSSTTQDRLLLQLGNGLLGNAANSLSAADRQKALEAEYRALEYSPAGRVVEWTGRGGSNGDVTAAQPYQVGSQNCRQYTHSFSIAGGAVQTMRGTACRNPDGSWTPLT
ncbi:hypothetical protein ACFO1V_13000 [Daeguia caeni]|uniref:Surface antigen domain-containing protein n=1 Tax=Daeguia caeni TaxID=439612 RepID=A0ABV9HAE1_9HYPH